MATPRPINEEFASQYDYKYTPSDAGARRQTERRSRNDNPRNGRGIKNPRVARRQPTFQQISNVENRRQRLRYNEENSESAKILPGKQTSTNETRFENKSNYRKELNRLRSARTLASRKKLSITKKILLRSRVLTITTSSLTWSIPTYLFVQLPFATLAFLAFGAQGIVETSSVFNLVTRAYEYVFSILGLPLVTFTSIFFLGNMVVLVTGLFTILIIGFQYKLALLNPLLGRGSAFKFGALLLAFVGYSVPGLNFIPWAGLWILAVFIYPK